MSLSLQKLFEAEAKSLTSRWTGRSEAGGPGSREVSCKPAKLGDQAEEFRLIFRLVDRNRE